MSRTMSRIALFVVLALGVGFVAACGGGEEPPASREFGDDDAKQELPGEVDSEVELDYHRKAFTAFVDADREYCIEGRTVIVFRDEKKKDVKVGRLQTNVEGEASLKDKRASGKYFARLLEEASARYGDLSLCLGDKSKTIRV